MSTDKMDIWVYAHWVGMSEPNNQHQSNPIHLYFLGYGCVAGWETCNGNNYTISE